MLDRALHTERTAATAASLLPLNVEGLVFAAGGRRLIDGIDLTLDAGPCTVIVGPNGAGKSLFLRLLHGLLPPSAGRVLWGGRPPSRAVRLRQAMVFQKPVLLRRSAAANMRFALRAGGLRNGALQAQSDTWLARAGLRDLAPRPARVLSGGEQQRLAVARALSREPEVLFLDEPTASLDPASILAIEALIRQAHAAGTKIVMVTHDLGQARRLADEIVFLCNGRVAEQAPADDFLDAPRSPKAQAFVAGRIVL